MSKGTSNSKIFQFSIKPNPMHNVDQRTTAFKEMTMTRYELRKMYFSSKTYQGMNKPRIILLPRSKEHPMVRVWRTPPHTHTSRAFVRLLQLLLGSDVGGVSAGLLPAIGGSGVETSVALAANHLVGVVLLGQNPQRGLNDTTTQTEHQMESGLWNDNQFIGYFDLKLNV